MLENKIRKSKSLFINLEGLFSSNEWVLNKYLLIDNRLGDFLYRLLHWI